MNCIDPTKIINSNNKLPAQEVHDLIKDMLYCAETLLKSIKCADQKFEQLSKKIYERTN